MYFLHRLKSVMITLYYKRPGVSRGACLATEKKIRLIVENLDTIQTELCYYIQTTQGGISDLSQMIYMFNMSSFYISVQSDLQYF